MPGIVKSPSKMFGSMITQKLCNLLKLSIANIFASISVNKATQIKMDCRSILTFDGRYVFSVIRLSRYYSQLLNM